MHKKYNLLVYKHDDPEIHRLPTVFVYDKHTDKLIHLMGTYNAIITASNYYFTAVLKTVVAEYEVLSLGRHLDILMKNNVVHGVYTQNKWFLSTKLKPFLRRDWSTKRKVNNNQIYFVPLEDLDIFVDLKFEKLNFKEAKQVGTALQHKLYKL